MAQTLCTKWWTPLWMFFVFKKLYFNELSRFGQFVKYMLFGFPFWWLYLAMSNISVLIKLGLCRSIIYSKFLIAHQSFHCTPYFSLHNKFHCTFSLHIVHCHCTLYICNFKFRSRQIKLSTKTTLLWLFLVSLKSRIQIIKQYISRAKV